MTSKPTTKERQARHITVDQLRNVLATQGISSRCFRYIMRLPGNARCFCECYLPKQATAKMRLTQIEVLPDRFVDPHVRDIVGDVVLRIPSRPKRGWTYVVILQCCRPHPLMPVYLDRCQKRVFAMHAETAKDNRPVDIYPSIYYTGRGPYPGPTKLEEVLMQATDGPVGQA